MTRETTAKAVVESALLGESAYTALRQAILSCSIPPGATLTEATVMERLKVGKSTCRFALVRLMQEGFVRSLPRQGYLVVPIRLADVEELFALRLLLEPEAARLAAGKVDADMLLRLERAGRNNKVSKDAGNRIGFFLDANREFHWAIAVASGNSRLAKSISGLLDEMKRLVALGFASGNDSPEIEGDHLELIKALAAGDGDAAAAISRRHIERFRDMTLERVLDTIRRGDVPLPSVRETKAFHK
jgi:DNA-binding GntR family transcriptional regulator